MEEPLSMERDVVKNGVRLDCVFEGYEYRPEREEVRSQRLAGFECSEIAENTGLSLKSRITAGSWGCRKREAASYSRRMGQMNAAARCADASLCREETVV